MEPNTTETIASPETEATSAPARRSPYMRLAVLGSVIAVLVLSYFLYTQMSVEVAAVVNGTKITQAEVDENVAMMKKSAELQGIDVTDPAILSEIESQALQNLINNELLLSAAQASGLSTNEAAVQTAYDRLVSEVGGEEALQTRMETVGLSEDILKGNISDRLVVDQYIESVTDIENLTVTDEEIGEYIASISTEGVTLPPLEEIQPQIQAGILAQKQQAIVDELITKLRNEATIEIKE